MFYHGSAIGVLTELKPFISEHKKPYIYFSTNPVVALLYSVRPVKKPFSWYPYGFDGEIVVYSEYYSDAFKDTYKDKKGYLYEYKNVPNTENPTSINCAYTCETPVKVDSVTEIPDIYDRFMKYQAEGLFRVKPFDEISEKEMQIVYDDLQSTISKYNLLSNPECQMSRFIKKNFQRLWEQAQVVAHYNALINENNDPVHDPEPLRAYMDKWDGQAFIDELQLSKDKSVLEIGVGTGRLAVKVVPKCGSFTGIDISPKTIERATENLADCQNTTLICDDFMSHKFSELYDVIYSSLTFMHIEDKLVAINKIAGLLKSDGRFVLSIDKNQDEYIEFTDRRIKVFPNNPDDICGYIETARLSLEKQFETEFAYIFVARKV
ncbi:MAG: class I SAM-dependent methyltransferase [Oscillospiraceae bacterium]|nr:class I SAM-dependent methyltransferase [Oscillospiraceae bacterium]MDD4413178.1 class I SAM-dependent methyltransferase [Oscillospiraceae bacterium]